ncbi:chromosome partitioning protein ParA, partial [Vibrio parahaemolyticus]|nr:chromosome partitioning protein ParA [Vibrio parahaemolyticus]
METLQPVGSLPCQRRDQAMKLSLLITVSAALAGIVWFSVNVDERDQLTQLSSELQDKSITLVDSDSTPPQRQSSTQKSKSKSDNMPTETQDLAERLNRSKGRALKVEIETFWHTCMSELNCEFKLNELAIDLSAERFNLLANYHQLD